METPDKESSRAAGRVCTVIDNDFYDELGVGGWWDEDGPQYGLHQLNPLRVKYFQECLEQEGLSGTAVATSPAPQLVEIGCGGGIVSEALCHMGYTVHGIDMSPGSVAVAQTHATQNGIPTEKLHYSVGNAYELPLQDSCADAVVMSDVLEHLDDLPKALAEVCRVLRPGGTLVFDTFNRTFLSWFFGIFGAQMLLKVVPSHCHDWDLFIKPTELSTVMEANNMRIRHLTGFSVFLNPFSVLWCYVAGGKPPMSFSLTSSLAVQYLGYAVKSTSTSTSTSSSTGKVKQDGAAGGLEEGEAGLPAPIDIEHSGFWPHGSGHVAAVVLAAALAAGACVVRARAGARGVSRA